MPLPRLSYLRPFALLYLVLLVLLVTAAMPRCAFPQQLVCARLLGTRPAPGPGREPPGPQQSGPKEDDTARLQAALDTCPRGQAVRLTHSADPGRNAFFAGPLHLPPGVMLILGAGVTLYASSPSASVPMLETGDAGVLSGPGVLEASPFSARSDLIRTDGSLTLLDLTLRAAPLISIHHTKAAPLRMQQVSVVSTSQPLALDEPAASIVIEASTFAGSEPLELPASAELSLISIYSSGTGTAPCRRADAPACVPTELPPILAHLELTPEGGVAAILTPAALSTPAPTGLVEFLDNGRLFATAELAGNAAEAPLPMLTPGEHLFSARTRDGTLGFGVIRRSEPHPRLQEHSTTTLSTSVARVAVGTLVRLAIDVTPATATGSVTLADGAQPLATLNLVGGSAVFGSNTFAPGTHLLAAAYAGDGNNAPSSSPPLTLIVDRQSTTLQLSPLPGTAIFGTLAPPTITASPARATGLVSLNDLASPGGPIAQANLDNGTASFSLLKLPVGSHTLSVSYAGDANDGPSTSLAQTVVVTSIPSSVQLLPIPAVTSFGSAVQLSAQLDPADATGTLAFTDSATGTLTQLAAQPVVRTVTSSLLPGLHRLSVIYSGDATHAGSTSPTETVEVQAAESSVVLAVSPASAQAGASFTLSATVAPASATGTILFRDSSSGPLGSAALDAGRASLKVATLAPGLHILTAAYGGDATDQPSTSSPESLTIAQHTTQLGFLSPPVSAPFGFRPLIAVSITPRTATGSLLFSDEDGPLGETILRSGSASLLLPELSMGRHSIVVTYAGDPDDSPASAPPFALTVVPDPTTTVVTLAANPIVAGTPLLVNVRVASANTIPTGTVTLRSGSLTLGSGVLSQAVLGAAFLTLRVPAPQLAPGSYPLLATYSGDSTDAPSDSSAAAQSFNIVPTPVTGLLTLSAVAYPAGSPATARVLLTSSSVPAGSISFLANGTAFATVPLDLQGSASAALPALPPGGWAVSALYLPSATFSQVSLAPVVANVQVPFSIAVTPATLTQAPGSSGSALLTVTPLNGFTGRVTVSCLPIAPFIHCTLSSATLFVGAAAPVDVAVGFAVGATTISAIRRPETVPVAAFASALLLMRHKRRRFVFLTAAVFLSVYLTGCGAGYFDTIVPGPYLVDVRASVPGFAASQPVTVNIP